MTIENKKKHIILIASQEITLRKFFIDIIKEYTHNQLSLTIICRDAYKLKELDDLNNQYKKPEFINLNFPKTIIEIINIFNLISIIFKLRKIFKKNKKKTYIHTNTPIASHLSRIANIFLNNFLIYHVHGFRFHKKGNLYRNGFNFILEFILNKFTNFYITINEEDTIIIKKYFKKKCFKVNGVGVNVEKILKIKKNYYKKDTKIIGFIGAYKKEKGYHDLIKLASKLKDCNVIIKCYGYGNIDKFRRIISKKNILNIELNEFTYDIYAKMADFDIFLCCSKREGLSVSILEAIALKIPVISSNIRGTIDILENDKFGFLFEPGDIKKIYDIIIEFLNDEKKFQNKANSAFKHILLNFDSKLISKKINNKILQL